MPLVLSQVRSNVLRLVVLGLSLERIAGAMDLESDEVRGLAERTLSLEEVFELARFPDDPTWGSSEIIAGVFRDIFGREPGEEG